MGLGEEYGNSLDSVSTDSGEKAAPEPDRPPTDPQARALFQPNRLEIYETLRESAEAPNISELCDALEADRPDVMPHIAAMDDYGLLEWEYTFAEEDGSGWNGGRVCRPTADAHQLYDDYAALQE